jgi:DNA-binding CsgD family transcriptional regulator
MNHSLFTEKMKLFSDHSDAIIVAIIYGYVDSVTFDSFDGVLDIYDDGKTMIQKLKKTVKDCTGQQKENSATDNADLSEREKEIPVSVAKGMTNKIIADSHNISVHTVIAHRKNIARKNRHQNCFGAYGLRDIQWTCVARRIK